MGKTLARIAMLALPALFTAACGGDLFGPIDGGMDLATGSGSCVAGTVLHHITNGDYNTVSATITQDTCNNPPLMPTEVMSTRTVTRDPDTGIVTVTGSTGGLIGSGPSRCNSGTITADYVLKQDPCQYETVRSSVMTITGDTTFTLEFTDQETNFMSTVGTCPHTTTCTTQFTVQMQLQ